MKVTCELFVATDGAARRYDRAWEEEAAFEEADDWLDDASDDELSAAGDDFEEEDVPTGPLHEAREALADHEEHKGLRARHLVALWRVLDGQRTKGSHALDQVPADGHRLLYRVPPAFNELLLALPEARVGEIARQWAEVGDFEPGGEEAASTLRTLVRMAGQARHHGLHLFLYQLS
jgi:hypothetical protein